MEASEIDIMLEEVESYNTAIEECSPSKNDHVSNIEPKTTVDSDIQPQLLVTADIHQSPVEAEEHSQVFIELDESIKTVNGYVKLTKSTADSTDTVNCREEPLEILIDISDCDKTEKRKSSSEPPTMRKVFKIFDRPQNLKKKSESRPSKNSEDTFNNMETGDSDDVVGLSKDSEDNLNNMEGKMDEDDDSSFKPDTSEDDTSSDSSENKAEKTRSSKSRGTSSFFPVSEKRKTRAACLPIIKRSPIGRRKRNLKDALLTKDEQALETKKERTNKKKQPMKKKVCKCQQTWLSMEEYKDWILKSENKNRRGDEMVDCRYCNVFIKAHKGALDNHRQSTIHEEFKKNEEQLNSMDTHAQNPLYIRIRRFELKLLALIACGNLSLALLDTLVPLLQYLLPQVDEVQRLKLHHTRGTQLLQAMGEEFQEELNKILRKQHFGLIFDESTDCSSTKQLMPGVTYFDKELYAPIERFFDILEPDGETAKEITDALVGSLESKSIPLGNVFNVCSDTCNTNFGEENSVTVHLRKQIPNLITIKCVCHLISLVSRTSFEKFPQAIDQMLHRLEKHFGKSAKNVKEFKALQELMDLEIHKILFLFGTRWLAHGQCINRVLEQYPLLQQYFFNLEEKFKNNKKKLAKLQLINSILQPPITKLYLEVSSYAISILDRFNKLFQKEVGLLFLLKPRLELMLKEFMGCFIQPKFLQNETFFF